MEIKKFVLKKKNRVQITYSSFIKGPFLFYEGGGVTFIRHVTSVILITVTFIRFTAVSACPVVILCQCPGISLR